MLLLQLLHHRLQCVHLRSQLLLAGESLLIEHLPSLLQFLHLQLCEAGEHLRTEMQTVTELPNAQLTHGVELLLQTHKLLLQSKVRVELMLGLLRLLLLVK